MSRTRVEAAGSIARVWRAEGFAAVRDRVWDRLRDASVRARCAGGGRDPWPSASILNVIGVPVTTMFGGVPVQLRARLRDESMKRPVALLSREPGGAGWRLEAWSDGEPRRAMAFSAGAWDGDPLTEEPDWLHAVRTCIRLVNARAVHVENAVGLSLVSLAALMGISSSTSASVAADGPGLPVVLSVHDRSLFSRDPQPLLPDASAHEPGQPLASHAPFAMRRSPQSAKLASPATPATPASNDARELPADDRQRFQHALHHALGTGIVRAAAFTIYPSQFMRGDVEVLPHLAAHVVAPGIELPARASRSARRPDEIALLGGGQTHKGGPRLARIAAALAARGLHVTSYGGYGHENLLAMRAIPGVRVRGYYRAGSLPGLLAGQGASVALILSAFAESFSLVLSEAWAAGVPVVAPATGAFPERIPPLGGLLVSANASDEEIIAAVDRARSMSWEALPTPPTASQAAERHLALYRDAGFIDGTATS